MAPDRLSLRLAVRLTAGLIVLAARPAPSFGQEQAPKKAAEPVKGKWAPLFARQAGEYTISTASAPSAQASRLPEPVLRWWQPVRGGDDGALYLWVKNGRPIAAMTFFTFKWNDGKRAIVHEHHAFADEPLDAEWRGRSMWHTTGPGVTFKPVPDAPKPASSRTARLRQMQALVREFSANTIDDKKSTWPLRPLATPLYRSDPGAATDTALFAFAQGTDPEAFLLLETRPEKTDARWEFALARFTDLELHIRYNGREVFAAPYSLGGADKPYQSIVAVNKLSDNPEDFESP